MIVTDGIESALHQARSAASGKDVVLGGGACLFAGLGPELELEQVRAVEAPGVTHLEYRVVR